MKTFVFHLSWGGLLLETDETQRLVTISIWFPIFHFFHDLKTMARFKKKIRSRRIIDLQFKSFTLLDITLLVF